MAHLSQTVGELDDGERVLESVERLKRQTRLATGREAAAGQVLEEFGFTGDRLTARIGDLSGGERRRLQLLRLLMEEPNVLLLDEPTNDLDIDTLTVVEDYLDTWPGTLIVVTHDRYFLERVCDVTYALMGDGSCVLLPGGIEQYLESRRAAEATQAAGAAGAPSAAAGSATSAAQRRQARKDMNRLESQMARIETQLGAIHTAMASAASDYARLTELQAEAAELDATKDELELAWLEAAELLD